MNKKQFTTRTGRSIQIDISDKACNKYDFKHGDRFVVNNLGENGTIAGIAPSRYNNTTLWYSLDRDKGKISYSEPFKKEDLLIVK